MTGRRSAFRRRSGHLTGAVSQGGRGTSSLTVPSSIDRDNIDPTGDEASIVDTVEAPTPGTTVRATDDRRLYAQVDFLLRRA